MAGSTTDRLAGRALTLALGGSNIDEARLVLLRLAADNRRAVEHALARIRRGLLARPSPVGERAADSLARVLEELDTRAVRVAAAGDIAG